MPSDWNGNNSSSSCCWLPVFSPNLNIIWCHWTTDNVRRQKLFWYLKASSLKPWQISSSEISSPITQQLKAPQMEWNIIFHLSGSAWRIICKIFAFPILYLDHQTPPPTSPPTGTISSCTISNQTPPPVFRKQMMDRQPAGGVKTELLYDPDN